MRDAQLVMGVATTLPAEEFEPFFETLRNSGYDGRTGLIIADYEPAEAARVSELADIVWNLDEDHPRASSRRADAAVRALKFLKHQRGLRRTFTPAFGIASRLSREKNAQRRWETLESRVNGLQSLRWGLYFEFLHRFAPQAQCVLLSDLRDVVFQGDPFSTTVRPLELYLEDPVALIGEDDFNSGWIRDLYGAEALARMDGARISCSGTVVGQRQPLLRYLHHMDKAISSRRIAMGPHDQGVHNYLIHQGTFPEASLLANGEGRVLTMGRMASPELAEGLVLFDGEPVPVLHQYDRFPDLVGRMDCLQRLQPQ